MYKEGCLLYLTDVDPPSFSFLPVDPQEKELSLVLEVEFDLGGADFLHSDYLNIFAIVFLFPNLFYLVGSIGQI